MDASTSFKTGGAPVGTGAAPVGSEAGNPGGGSKPAAAKSVADLLQLMSAPTKLSKDGEAYVDAIVDALTKADRTPKVTSITGPNYEARIINNNGFLTALVFAETYTPGTPPLPAAAVVNDLRGRFTSHGVSGTPAIFQVVTKEQQRQGFSIPHNGNQPLQCNYIA